MFLKNNPNGLNEKNVVPTVVLPTRNQSVISIKKNNKNKKYDNVSSSVFVAYLKHYLLKGQI